MSHVAAFRYSATSASQWFFGSHKYIDSCLHWFPIQRLSQEPGLDNVLTPECVTI